MIHFNSDTPTTPEALSAPPARDVDESDSELLHSGAEGRGPRRIHLPPARPLLFIVVLLSLFFTATAWAISSPTASSPDDDYHLGSIWCPRPATDSCQTRIGEKGAEVLVPKEIAPESLCYQFHSDVSAACSLHADDSALSYSGRYDDGGYPWGYYQFHHLLITHDVDRSVLLMRVVNIAVSVLLLGAIAHAMPGRYRRPFVLAIIASWIPMGLFFLASNNPSSWALTGVLAWGAALFSALRTTGAQRIRLLALGSIGALLCLASRGDAAFFVFVVALAIVLGVPFTRERLPVLALASAASIAGIAVMLSTGQSSAVSSFSTVANSPYSFPRRIVLNLLSSLEYVAGFFGRRWGAGWFDVPFDGPIVLIALGIFGGLLLVGAGRWRIRKALSLATIIGAMIGIPFVVAMQNSWPYVYQYQPRYQLPLLAVMVFVLLAHDERSSRLTGLQELLLLGASALAHALALHTLIYRFSHGLGDPFVDLTMNLDFQVAWWRSIPFSPMTVWIAASLMYTIALTCVFALDQKRREREPVGNIDPL